MGCDIHLHEEVKINGVWHHYGHPCIDRNYRLFGLMAGVRDDTVKPVSTPKGIPEDVSLITKLDYDLWRLDAHSQSWLSVEEIGKLADQIRAYKLGPPLYCLEASYGCGFDYLFGGTFGSLFKYPDSYPKEIEDARYVFWFDN